MDRKPDTLLFTDRNTREFWHFYTTLHRPDGQHDDRFLMYYDSQMLQIGTGRVASIDFGAYEITTKDTIPAGTRFVIVDDTVPERVLIQNNHFHHHRARRPPPRPRPQDPEQPLQLQFHVRYPR
jgi:hypothetical protein